MKKKILVIIADYYKDISNDLLKSTLNNLNKKHYSIKILKVPGVFEIPVTISRNINKYNGCLLYTSPSPRDLSTSRMPSSA